jgi:hypothetical protein
VCVEREPAGVQERDDLRQVAVVVACVDGDEHVEQIALVEALVVRLGPLLRADQLVRSLRGRPRHDRIPPSAGTVEREVEERPPRGESNRLQSLGEVGVALRVDDHGATARLQVAEQRREHRRRLARPGRADQQRVPSLCEPKGQVDHAAGAVHSKCVGTLATPRLGKVHLPTVLPVAIGAPRPNRLPTQPAFLMALLDVLKAPPLTQRPTAHTRPEGGPANGRAERNDEQTRERRDDRERAPIVEQAQHQRHQRRDDQRDRHGPHQHIHQANQRNVSKL